MSIAALSDLQVRKAAKNPARKRDATILGDSPVRGVLVIDLQKNRGLLEAEPDPGRAKAQILAQILLNKVPSSTKRRRYEQGVYAG
jgi:hypothetical protein